MVSRRHMSTATNNTLNGQRSVTFKRDILVANPKNRFENSRFGIELSDERGAGESYAAVYERLSEAGNRILAEQILRYKTGIKRDLFDDTVEKIRKEHGLY